MNSASKNLPGCIRILSGDEKNKLEQKLVFRHLFALINGYSHPNDFKIIPGDLRQALDQPGINPGRSLDEARMTPR